MTDRPDLAPMADTVSPRECWRQIERDARAHAMELFDAEEHRPLVLGAHIAWVTTMYGRTDGLSPVHRVGAPIGDKPHTVCQEAIPHPIQHMILSPALIDALEPCRFCAMEHKRGANAHAA